MKFFLLHLCQLQNVIKYPLETNEYLCVQMTYQSKKFLFVFDFDQHTQAT